MRLGSQNNLSGMEAGDDRQDPVRCLSRDPHLLASAAWPAYKRGCAGAPPKALFHENGWTRPDRSFLAQHCGRNGITIDLNYAGKARWDLVADHRHGRCSWTERGGVPGALLEFSWESQIADAGTA